MNKGRVEAFTDAVMAIIMTIMVLEIQMPKVGTLSGLASFFPYFVSFAISFIFICIAWYNHHYLFTITKWISRKAFWANNLWLFVMAFIPLATAWVSEFWWMRAPVYFYLIIYLLWDIAFYLLTKTTYQDNKDLTPKHAHKMKMAKSFSRVIITMHIVLFTIGFVGIYFYPIIGVLVILAEAIIWFIDVPKDGDKIAV